MGEKLIWERDGVDWPNHSASQFVEAAGFPWHVQIAGSGPTLLLIHGTGAANHSWRDLLPLLAEHFTVIAPDLPGHGFSGRGRSWRLSLEGMAEDTAALLTELNASPALVVGHSAGAAILAQMCLDGGVDPRLLISLNGALVPLTGMRGDLFSPMAKLLSLIPQTPALFSAMSGNVRSVRRLLSQTGSAVDEDMLQHYVTLVASRDHVDATLTMMSNWDLPGFAARLQGVTCPSLLVATAGDLTVPSDDSRRAAQIMQDATLKIIPKLGHLAHEEDPATFAELITEAAKDAGILKASAAE